MGKILELQSVHKRFEAGTPNENHVLKGIDLSINEEEFITVIGGNGADKSTFLNTIAGTLTVDQGNILLEGNDITSSAAYIRSKYINRVFQDAKMGTASRLSIEENLAIAWKRGKSRKLGWGIRDNYRDIFKKELVKLDLGLEDRLKMEVGLLSGGQRQV